MKGDVRYYEIEGFGNGTALAHLVTFSGGRKAWIPKKLVQGIDSTIIAVPAWFIVKDTDDRIIEWDY